MDNVIQLSTWIRAREEEPPETLATMDRAIARLDAIVPSRPLPPAVRTELLAILGELGLELYDDAAARAERLADRLAAGGRTPARGQVSR